MKKLIVGTLIVMSSLSSLQGTIFADDSNESNTVIQKANNDTNVTESDNQEHSDNIVSTSTPVQEKDGRQIVALKENPLWSNFSWSQKGTTVANKNYESRVKYRVNGQTYLSLYDNNIWQGYVNSDATAQQVFQTKDIIITANGYNLWNDLGFKSVRNVSTDFKGKPLQIKCYWNHGNGSVYYSIYDGDNWLGYLNKQAIAITNKTSPNKEVSITDKNEKLWSDFSFHKVTNTSGTYYNNNQTLIAKDMYTGINGESYYSVYDHNNNWQGFINTKFVKPITQEKDGKNVVILADSPVWSSFAWKQMGTVKATQTFESRVKYGMNGRTYLSLYSNNKWQGYINSGSTASQVLQNKNVEIKAKGYKLWNNLTFKSVRNTSDKFVGKTLQAKCYWNHSNGSVYYSLYDGKTWLGYINKDAVKDASSGVEKAIKVALSKVGKPYAYGAAGPNAFDCSGLTQFSYKGIHKLDRTTTQQENDGKQVSVNSLKRGDLVFWGSHGSTYHVGLYLGNNEYVHAPKPGDKVKVEKIISAFKPSFGVRL